MLACDFPVPVPTSQMVGHTQHTGMKRRFEPDADYPAAFPKRATYAPPPPASAPPSFPPSSSSSSFPAAAQPAYQTASTAPPSQTVFPAFAAPQPSTSQPAPAVPPHHKRTPTSAPPLSSLPPHKRPRPSPCPSPNTPLQPPTTSCWQHPTPPHHTQPATPPLPSSPRSSPTIEEILPLPPHHPYTPTATTPIPTPTPTPNPPSTPDAAGLLQLSRYLPPLAYDKINLAPPVQQLLEEQLQTRFQLLQPSHTATGDPNTGALIVYDPAAATHVTHDKLQSLAQQAACLFRPRTVPACTIEEVDSASPSSTPPSSPPPPQSEAEMMGDDGMAGVVGAGTGGYGSMGCGWGAAQGGLGQQQQEAMCEAADVGDMDLD